MKKSFTLAALLLVLSTGLFAASPAKTFKNEGDENGTVLIQAMRTALGFGVSIQNPAKATVTIIDKNNNVILADNLGRGKSVEKAYNLSELENGNYTVTINNNNTTITKQLHVYEEYGNKAYIFIQ
ncbi:MULTISPECIES: hypothetical protein [unclassified Mucilaginibacter]|uniref:hypothetical protein n=1 Tax=unclassified Mucilaginibacter TaxID=2617802 RepID=UPI002AC91489|nr:MULTISPECIES: hypothetical protein [unclassified Mucilaginibacter]MEB0262461.1 hypothetical protein [Mucilaginibacter sp. 10I4]MEB0279286.1 hypothetical protein [Mucilaginibacter sp. 10B2]MEB0302576.1 hypothetical protein [Mucilaginibacter sp. 5C4]WPX23202.1 hypothetical protein RHM67_18135 [Mucilaginibacter sp. 5C4]